MNDDAALLAIRDFVYLVAQHAQNPAQRERVARAARVPVSGASLSVLRIVEQYGPVAVSAIARRLGVDVSTASRQLKPLEEERLVRRSVDPDDARVASLGVTARGRALLARADSVMLNDFDVALASWSASDRRQLGSLLDRFRESLLSTRTDADGWSVLPDAPLSRTLSG